MTVERLKVEKMKKTLLNVIRHYHPDKQDKNDEKRFFIAEEICKLLNTMYDCYKSDPSENDGN